MKECKYPTRNFRNLEDIYQERSFSHGSGRVLQPSLHRFARPRLNDHLLLFLAGPHNPLRSALLRLRDVKNYRNPYEIAQLNYVFRVSGAAWTKKKCQRRILVLGIHESVPENHQGSSSHQIVRSETLREQRVKISKLATISAPPRQKHTALQRKQTTRFTASCVLGKPQKPGVSRSPKAKGSTPVKK